MKKQLLLIVMLLSAAASAFAEEVEINGLRYDVNTVTKEATVIWYKNDDNKYEGNIVIPETVLYGGVTCSVTSIGNHTFQACFDLTSVTIPNSVTSIGDYAFYYCNRLTSVTIPNSVTSIGSGAFRDCDGLQKVIVKDIAAWCGISFSDNHSNPLYYAKHLCSDENTEITELIIPNSVTSIGDYAFCQCFDLTSVTIGNSVTSIGSRAFRGCTGLTSVTCYAENVPSTGSNAFDSSNVGNATLYVPTASIDAYKTTEPWSSFKVIEGIETGIKDIKTNATSSSPIYDLHGRRVEKTTKGLYIVNGNKVMMK